MYLVFKYKKVFSAQATQLWGPPAITFFIAAKP